MEKSMLIKDASGEGKEKVVLDETDEGLITFFEEEASPEIKFSDDTLAVIESLKKSAEKHPGKWKTLLSVGGDKEVVAMFDKNTERFYQMEKDGVTKRELGLDSFSNFVEHNRFVTKHTYDERVYKNKPTSKQESVSIPVVEVSEEEIPPVSDVNDSGDIDRLLKLSQEVVENKQTEPAEEQEVVAVAGDVKVDAVVSDVSVTEEVAPELETKPEPEPEPKQEQEPEPEPLAKDMTEVAEEGVETEPFVAKSSELQELLKDKRFKGKRTVVEMEALISDIKQAAKRVVDGENIEEVIASLGLDKSPKVSKTLEKRIPEALRAELAMHTTKDVLQEEVSQEAIEEVQENGPDGADIVQESVNLDKEPINNEVSEEVSKDGVVGTSALKDKIFGKDWDEKKAEEKAGEKTEEKENIEGVEKEFIKEEEALNEELFGRNMTEEESALLDAQNEKIGKLKEAMIAARQEYARIDYKQTDARDKVRRFFGKNLFKDIDPDVIAMKTAYQSALMDYTNARLEAARTLSGSSEELLKKNLIEVLKEVEIQERVDMYDARINAKMPNWLADGMEKAVDWYRGLSFKERMAFSLAMIASGGALGVAAGAGAASVAFLARRWFGGAVAGRGVFQFSENLSQKTVQKEFDTDIRDAQKEMTFTENADDMVRQMQERLSSGIGSSDAKLNDMMKSRTRNTVAGFAAGTFLGSGMPQFLIEKFQEFGSVVDMSSNASMTPIEESPVASGIVEKIVEDIEKPVELVIQPGSEGSIEGQLIKHLTESGHAEDAGVKAHLLVVNYLKEHGGNIESLNKILSGTIHLSPDSLHIESIDTVPMRAVAEHASVVHSKIMESVVNATPHFEKSSIVPNSDIAAMNVADIAPTTETIFKTVSPPVGINEVIENVYQSKLFGSELIAMDKSAITQGIAKSWFKGDAWNLAREIKGMTIAEMQNDTSGKYALILKRIAATVKDAGIPLQSRFTPLQVMAEATKAYVEKKSMIM